MPKASELRKIADSFDRHMDTDIPKPFFAMPSYTKEHFLATAKVMPRPIAKSISGEGTQYPQRILQYKTDAITLYARVNQSLTCELIEPAKPAVYRCDPVLSEEEDAELEVS